VKSTQIKQLNAVSIGKPALNFLRDPLTLSIHSVFQKVVNIKTDSPLIITIANSEQKNLPYGLLCNTTGIDFRNLLLAGQPVVVGDKTLNFIDRLFVIDFSSASIWHAEYQKTIHGSSLDQIRVRLEWLKHYSQIQTSGRGLTSLSHVIDELVHGQPIQLSTRMEQKAVVGLADVLEGLHQLDYKKIVDGGQELIGLGVGLTPSGDDLLISLLLSVIAVNQDPVRRIALNAVRDLSAISQNKTTDISINQYQIASEGYLSKRFMDVIESIINLDPQTIMKEKADFMISFGETSGLEILIGLLLGMRLNLTLRG
jgi:hypothetical protein